MEVTSVKMTKTTLFVGVGAIMGLPMTTWARDFKMPETKVSMETCLKAAFAKRTGEVEKLELKITKGEPIYEIEIKGADGTEWEYECSARTGGILSEEREVRDVNDPLFKDKAKVTLDQARKTALDAHPGDIVETEYELKQDGTPVYEFDIWRPSPPPPGLYRLVR
jgi:uncharacterized membrane protein YkoI